MTASELALQGLKVTLPILSGTVPDQKKQRIHKHMQDGEEEETSAPAQPHKQNT